MIGRNQIAARPSGIVVRAIRHLRKALADRRGVAAVEFGLALPAFLLLVCGTIEFSRVLWSQHALGFAAEQATRYALANPSASSGDIQAYAEGQLVAIDVSTVTVSVIQETLDGIDYLTVSVASPFQAILPFVPIGSLALTGISRIPIDA